MIQSYLYPFAIIAFLSLIHSADCFQSRTVAPGNPPHSVRSIQLESQRSPSADNPSNAITSSLISSLAVAALKLRLKDQTQVACDVTASSKLLRGQVGPVCVKGRGWKSNLGLSCRAIEATVDTCSLDMSRIVSNRKLVLTVPGKMN